MITPPSGLHTSPILLNKAETSCEDSNAMSKLKQLDQLLDDFGYPTVDDLDEASREALATMCRGPASYRAAFIKRGWMSWFRLHDDRLWNEGGPSSIVEDVLRRAGIEIINVEDVFGEEGILLEVQTSKGSWSFIVERGTGLPPNDRTGFEIISTATKQILMDHDIRLADLSGTSETIKRVPLPLAVWNAIRQSKLLPFKKAISFDDTVTDEEARLFKLDARLAPAFELLRSRAWQKRRKVCTDEVAGRLRPDHAGSKELLLLMLSDPDELVRKWALETATEAFDSTFETAEAAKAALKEL